MTWTPDENYRGSIEIVTCNDETLNTGWSTSGSVTISFPANQHSYTFKGQRWFNHNTWGWGWYNNILPGRFLQVFLDETNLNQPQNDLGGMRGICGYFYLRTSGSGCSNKEILLTCSASAECNGPNYTSSDPVNLEILEGEIHLTFYNTVTGTDLGSSIQIAYNELPNILLARKENAPPFFTAQTAIIQANINGVIGSYWDIYYPATYVIRVPAYPDTMNNGNIGNIYIDILHNCQIVPGSLKINIDIIDGNEYGNLIDPVTGDRVQSITELGHYYGNANVNYIADGISAESTDSVIIRISTTDPEVYPKDIKIFINPPPLAVTIEPEVLSASDTATVIIKRRNPDGSLEDFPPDQTFEIAATEGCINGNILANDSLGVYFPDAQLPIYFVAADTIEENSGYVRLRAGTDLSSFTKPAKSMEKIKAIEEKQLFENEEVNIDGKIYRRAELITGFEKMISEKKSGKFNEKNKTDEVLPTEALLSDVCYTGEFLYETDYWIGDVMVEGEPKILLGETKYYQARYLNDKLVIDELSGPNLWNGGLASDVWGDEPVTITEGDKLGVYWEKEKPVWNGSIKGGNLQTGLIRLVGKYWQEGKTYSVKLTATDGIKNHINYN